MTRRRARSKKGSRVFGSVPSSNYKQVTLLGAVGLTGLMAMMTIEASTCTDVFLAFIKQVLLPELSPGQVVVGAGRRPRLDNLQAHKVPRVRVLIESAGCQLMYLPRYSPEFSPIEPCWSKLKARLRALGARTVEALDASLLDAMSTVTAQDARGWFGHCGYSKPL